DAPGDGTDREVAHDIKTEEEKARVENGNQLAEADVQASQSNGVAKAATADIATARVNGAPAANNQPEDDLKDVKDEGEVSEEGEVEE
ncbi:hypothetical protein LTR53_020574, partial [Teratosphaeriaceae sp. CCFEE 6253]